jgi:predicted GTPase
VDARALDSVQSLLAEVDRWVREDRVDHDTCNLMVVGVPNCGKSTLINALHRLSRGAVKGLSIRPVGWNVEHLRTVTRGRPLCVSRLELSSHSELS